MRGADEPAAQPTSESTKTTPSMLRRELAQFAASQAATLKGSAPAREEDLGPGDSRIRDVSLEAGRCYRFLAVAGAPVTGLSLRLRDAAGVEVAAHEADARALALPKDKPYCAAKTVTHQLTIAVKGGAGLALWQPFGGTDPSHQARFPIGGDANNAVSKRVRDAHATLAAGTTAAMAFATGTLATAQRAEASFAVQPGTCYDAVAAGTPSLRSLDIEIVDQRDSVIAEARDQGTTATTRACASIPGTWRVRARAFKGYGEYGVQVFASP